MNFFFSKNKKNPRETEAPVFRKLEEGDIPGVEKLFKELVGSQKPPKIASLSADSRTICLVAELAGEIIGFGCLSVYRTPTMGETGRIEDLIVSKNARGKGYGEKIMRELIAAGQKSGIKKISLTSNPMRKAARKLYRKLGFQKIMTDTFVLRIK